MVSTLKTIHIKTNSKEEIIDITKEIQDIVQESARVRGICTIYSPHTTAGITINENCDPDVKCDILMSLNDIVRELDFKHSEGNSSAHVKTSLVGKSQTLIINNNKITLGMWDGIYFCEFDGPRNRQVFVKIIEG